MTRKTMEEFCWSVIFELRQPMTAISGNVQRAQLLLHTNPSGAREALDTVVAQIARIDRVLVELYERERRTTETTAHAQPNGHRHAREGAST